MIRHVFLPMVLALSLSALLPAAAQQRQIINIDNDKGGNVMEAIQRRNALQASGKRVQIRGYCRSACTIYLTLPNACLGPNASVGFHAPRIPGTSIIPPIVGDLMGQFYRGEVRRKWYTEWQYSLKMHKMSSAQYKKLDPQIEICWSK